MPILGVIDSGKSGHLAAPGSYYSIATTTVGSGGASSITFSSIPSTYTNLQLRILARETGGTSNQSVTFQFNSDTGNNYSVHRLTASGSGVAPDGAASISVIYNGSFPTTSETANLFGAGIFDILDYTNTNKNKTLRSIAGYDNNGTGWVYFCSGAWYNTSAINSITIAGTTGFAQYSSFALYGVK
jgi:hypothetical protein